MIQISCRTNLDLRGEEWPNELPCIPHVGELIQSKTKHGRFQLELAVVRVIYQFHEGVYTPDFSCKRDIWIPHIELHMSSFHHGLYPKYRDDVPMEERTAAKGSIKAFYDWYAPLVGTTTGAFI